MENPNQEVKQVFTSPIEQELKKYNLVYRKIIATILLCLSDSICLAFSMLTAIIFRDLFLPGNVHFQIHLSIIPISIIVFLIGFYIRRLYPGFGMTTVDELRVLSYTITLIYAMLASLAFLFKYELEQHSRLIIVFSWLFSLAMVPLGRGIIRKLFADKPWWGLPVLIIGAAKEGKAIISALHKNLNIGFKPIAAVDNNEDRWGYFENVPIAGSLDIIPEITDTLHIDHAIITISDKPENNQHEIIKKYSKYFSNLFYIPNNFSNSFLWVSTCDVGGILTFHVKNNLYKLTSKFKKRIFDLFFTSFLALVALPFILIISALIFIESKGKIFFYQERIGYNNSLFKVYKFRTMYNNAELQLQKLINSDNKIKEEWEVYHKLKNDPRITPIGRILRKYSLDELPQLWNIICGDMSLIGPRAVSEWEKQGMNGHENFILNVKPGLTGLWQVSDRNSITFEERLPINIYYIRNWSIFLDVYILARTISTVILGKGGN